MSRRHIYVVVRRANPAFAKMTNQQIQQYADYLEKASSDPNMMKEIEMMSKMSTTYVYMPIHVYLAVLISYCSDREQLQAIQEGLAGSRDMNDKWIADTIITIKSNPGVIKTMLKGKGEMLGGVSDDQINGFIDGASAMDPSTLTFIIRWLKFLGSLYKPASEVYRIVDKYSYGQAKYIFLAVVLVVLTIVATVLFRTIKFVISFVWSSFVSGAAAKSGVGDAGIEEAAKLSDAASTPLGGSIPSSQNAPESLDSEFDF